MRPAAPGAPAGTPGPPPAPRRGPGRWIAAVLLLAVLGAVGWYVLAVAPTSARAIAVGDCVATTGADEVRVVGCADPAAAFRVVGRLEDRTMIDAGLFACSEFSDATSAFWQGRAGGPSERGTVLCLAPAPTPDPVAADA